MTTVPWGSTHGAYPTHYAPLFLPYYNGRGRVDEMLDELKRYECSLGVGNVVLQN